MSEIRLVEVGHVDRSILEFMATMLADCFSVPCWMSSDPLDLDGVYDFERQQYHSTEILSRLTRLEPPPGQKILGVADVDLFIPILTFVFGEAQLGNATAVVSIHRLRQEFYGLPPDEDLLYERAQKEAIHELGHTFGLIHCHDFNCVMRSSNSITEVDIKPDSFCADCESRVARAVCQ